MRQRAHARRVGIVDQNIRGSGAVRLPLGIMKTLSCVRGRDGIRIAPPKGSGRAHEPEENSR